MLFQRRLIIVILGFILLCIALLWASYHQVGLLKRDPQVLMNTYYQLKHSNPDAAHEALHLILKQNKHYVPALIELSQWLIQEKRFSEALPLLEQLHQQRPDERQYLFQLAYLYYIVN
jgi:cytochrome c-type biogenesis protein CcmH/NrfG